ncbi:MAG: NAD(P)-binding domain-containing protein [Actinomycetota bacterium]|nr:NAD(P)-binding domain-containing protein [Actinomycetota bacterium]
MEKTEIFEYMAANGHEKVLCLQNEDVGLRAVLAIHSTVLGPAAGGCRMWTYSDDLAAMEDALRLSKGMTYKYAAAGINLGGGKIVVIGDPKRRQGREMLFRALGRFIDSLGGEYLTGEDVGTTLQDMDHMRAETRNVITLPESAGGAGPIGPATAFGVLQAMRACVEEHFGSTSLRGKRVVVQGLGSVGEPMVRYLVDEGATVLVSDIDSAKVEAMVKAHGVTAIDAADVVAADVDVYCPCALGATINDESLAVLTAPIVCGSANNQLAEPRHGDELQRRGVVYAPDYIANAGGTVFDTDRLWGGVNKERGMAKVAKIYERMHEVFTISKSEGIATSAAADRLAESRINEYRSIKRVHGFDQGQRVTI